MRMGGGWGWWCGVAGGVAGVLWRVWLGAGLGKVSDLDVARLGNEKSGILERDVNLCRFCSFSFGSFRLGSFSMTKICVFQGVLISQPGRASRPNKNHENT